ncbi:MAG: NAD(P)H-quinone oxidoreductase [Fimbriimonadaceae bacterium]|nr:NAD(P)H-quinone oxidoreductase [Alphaproteobacteria bacterium]
MSLSLPESMTGIAISEPGDPTVLIPEQRVLPTPMPGEILVKVEAAGVNRPDVMQRMGLYPAPKGASDLPGLEIAGSIVKLGRDTSRYRLGDKICALAAGGGYAEYCVVPESNALPVPAGLSMIEAAALPETCFTVWHNVFERGALKSGETLLVHGGTSGIGTTAIMLATARGARVLTTAGSAEKCAFCEKLGAARAINYLEEDFPSVVKEVTQNHGADVILDMVGGDYIERNYDAAAIEGRIVQIALMRGRDAEVNFTRLMVKRLTHTGSTLRPRSVEFKGAIARQLEEHVWPLIAEGKFKPIIDSTFPLTAAADAHKRMESSKHIGKIMLEV